jgi:hypothetical protein
LPRPSALPRRPSRLLSVLPSCRSARLVHSARWLPPAALPAAESLEPAARATGGRLLGGLVAAAAATSRPDVAIAPLDAALLTIRARATPRTGPKQRPRDDQELAEPAKRSIHRASIWAMTPEFVADPAGAQTGHGGSELSLGSSAELIGHPASLVVVACCSGRMVGRPPSLLDLKTNRRCAVRAAASTGTATARMAVPKQGAADSTAVRAPQHRDRCSPREAAGAWVVTAGQPAAFIVGRHHLPMAALTVDPQCLRRRDGGIGFSIFLSVSYRRRPVGTYPEERVVEERRIKRDLP